MRDTNEATRCTSTLSTGERCYLSGGHLVDHKFDRDNRAKRAARNLASARYEAAVRNAQQFGTDPSWYGL